MLTLQGVLLTLQVIPACGENRSHFLVQMLNRQSTALSAGIHFKEFERRLPRVSVAVPAEHPLGAVSDGPPAEMSLRRLPDVVRDGERLPWVEPHQPMCIRIARGHEVVDCCPLLGRVLMADEVDILLGVVIGAGHRPTRASFQQELRALAVLPLHGERQR